MHIRLKTRALAGRIRPLCGRLRRSKIDLCSKPTLSCVKVLHFGVFKLRFLFVLFLVLATPSWAEKRVAFLVGNSNYEHAPPLANPIRDTILIAETLTGLGFEVTQRSDLNREQIGRELSAFLRRTSDADVTLFYFAGHGMQYEGRNYLIGTNAELQSELDIDGEALQLDKIVRLLERNSRAALVFVDACRNNPLADRFYAENFSETRAAVNRGLAALQSSFQGSMITFSASPGQVAYDGKGENSPFALALARHFPTENLEVLSLMKRVIRDVKVDTDDRQIPMVTNDLTDEIYLKLGEGGTGNALLLQQEQALFDAASDLNSLRAWNIFLERYPNGLMREMALAAQEALQAKQIAAGAGVGVADLGPQAVEQDTAQDIETRLGLSSQDNRKVQAALNDLGYNAGPVDGVMGSRTRRAIANYQQALGIPSTGVVSQGTAEALGLSLSGTEKSEQPVVSSRDARRYDPALIAKVESDKRLIKALDVLAGKEVIYGFFEGRVYIAILNWSHMAWDRAVELSERAGGHLVTITSRRENDFVYDLIRGDDRLWIKGTVGTRLSEAIGPNIGLYQKPGSREPAGGWVWVTGEPLAYTNWKGSNPDNYANREHHAIFYNNAPYGGPSARVEPAPVWNDIGQRDGVRSFIIEIE